jgi:hypothetical protein
METILIMLVVGALNIGCFFVGAKVGNKVAKGESIELPSINPIEKIHEIKDKQEARKEKSRMDIIMSNIDNYDGTSAGQIDVPR